MAWPKKKKCLAEVMIRKVLAWGLISQSQSWKKHRLKPICFILWLQTTLYCESLWLITSENREATTLCPLSVQHKTLTLQLFQALPTYSGQRETWRSVCLIPFSDDLSGKSTTIPHHFDTFWIPIWTACHDNAIYLTGLTVKSVLGPQTVLNLQVIHYMVKSWIKFHIEHFTYFL